MRKSFILLLGLMVLISGCVQQPTGQVASQEPTQQPTQTTSTQQPIEQPISQLSQIPSEPVQTTTQQNTTEVTTVPVVTKTDIKQQIIIQNFSCEGTAKCYSGNVTRILDGDTIEVDSVRIRLVLVDAPESSQVGGFEATNFIHQNCPVGSQVILDQDDSQLYDNYGRLLAVVWCRDKRVNEETILQGYANIYYEFCSQSEFGDDDWAVKLGCTEPQDCDSSYPTVCIPPPPPDLDCSDISYKRFEVRQPDPHRFDGDKDGIGCES